MKEELGKWLMDISKYIITAVLITALLGNIENTILMIALATVVAITTLVIGLALVNNSNRRSRTKKKK